MDPNWIVVIAAIFPNPNFISHTQVDIELGEIQISLSNYEIICSCAWVTFPMESMSHFTFSNYFLINSYFVRHSRDFLN